MLWLPGADGNHGWQDHVSYVVREEEWPTKPYATARGRQVVALVNGVPGSGKSALARQLAAELRIPLFFDDVITGSAPGALWAPLHDSPVGGVVAGWFRPEDVQLVVDGLHRCGLDPAAIPEVWCFSAHHQSSTRPLGLGLTLAVDTGQDLTPGDIVRIALQLSSTRTSPAFET